MRRARVLAGPFLLLVFLLAPREAAACSCMASGPACQAFWNTDAVFDATVDSKRPRWDQRIISVTAGGRFPKRASG